MLPPDRLLWRAAGAAALVSAVGATGFVAVENTTSIMASAPASSYADQRQGQVLSVPLRRINHRGVATPSLARRFLRTDVLGVFGAAYLAELAIGTGRDGRRQVVDVLIDTGSFELWVDPVCSASNVPQFCEAFGRYDPALSTTSRKVGDRKFTIKYGSGQVMGDYYRDDIYISGAKIRNQQFGVANTSDLVWFGIMGLGHGFGNGFIDYPLVTDSLAAQGLTNTKLFSMDLGKQIKPGAAVTGEMAFGGVDRNKYAGYLKKVPTDPSDPHYKITLNSLAHRAPGAAAATPFADSANNLPLPVIVDSGTTLSLLPEALVGGLAAQFPGARPDGNGGYRVDCALQRKDGSVAFEFLSGNGTVVINVAYSDFIWNSGGDCFLGAWFTDDLGIWILGDTFLRGAYVTFDQTNNALFMANHLSCGDGRPNLVAVPAGPDAAGRIPGACSAPAMPHVEPPITISPSSSVAHAVPPTPEPGSPSDDAGADGPGFPTSTITNTITRAADHVSTRHETVFTTCAEHGSSLVPIPIPSAAATGSGPIKSQAAAPTRGSGQGREGDQQQQQHQDEGNQDEDEGEEQRKEEDNTGGSGREDRMMTTTAYKTTMTYEITSCPSEAAAAGGAADTPCTPGMTTVRATTIVRTVHVRPVATTPSSSSPSPPNPHSISQSLSSSSSFPLPPPPSFTSWKSHNTTTATAATATPSRNDNVIVTAGAASTVVDDGQVDRRYLGAVFAVVCGVMMLL
ncbi:aspartic peptidase domain-containing protein [Nemania sp. NC0429]|nr:aspartic peptidase domain-containing protein [Nemania sp. NC0429]